VRVCLDYCQRCDELGEAEKAGKSVRCIPIISHVHEYPPMSLLYRYLSYRTVSIECCYQNVGIATSVALTMFEGEELAAALGVPFFYGVVEAVLLGIYCIVAWKIGWTKAPKDVSIWKALTTSYEIVNAEKKDAIIQPDQELSSNTLPTNEEEEEDDDDGFHYVQHSDAEPSADEEAPEERIEDAKPTPSSEMPPEAKEPLVAKAGSADV
jgi:hypothetical protein